MARHARPSAMAQWWTALRLRMGRVLAPRGAHGRRPGRHAQTARPRPAPADRALAAAAVVAAAAVYLAFFVLGHATLPQGAPHTAAARGHRGEPRATHPPAASLPAAVSSAVPAAQPTPPPVVLAPHGSVQPQGAGRQHAIPAPSESRRTSGGAVPSTQRPARSGTGKAIPEGGRRAPTRAASPQGSGGAVRRSTSTPAQPQPGRASEATASAPDAVRVAPALESAVPGMVPPVSGKLLSGFGWAYSPVFADWQEHTGVDLAVGIGQAVRAPASGVVLAVRHDPLWGWVVSLSLPHGYSTNISGLARVAVHVGQHLGQGEILGEAGASPPAESNLAPHVFWQVFDGRTPVNPVG
jgi:biotin carboxyl carrier protein